MRDQDLMGCGLLHGDTFAEDEANILFTPKVSVDLRPGYIFSPLRTGCLCYIDFIQ